ncbi:MAG: hypothetical protein ABIJ09_08805 [Pseudomonadota bacterium]
MTDALPTPTTAPAPDATRPGLRLLGWAAAHRDLCWGLALGLVTYVTLRITSPTVGFTRDEGYYFKAGEQYWGWYRELWRNLFSGRFFETFSDATIVRFFEYNHEHPVLIKTLMGATWWWTHEVLGISSNAEGFRVVGPLFAALCTGFTFALGRRAGLGRPFALFAGLAWWWMPHNYFYSHLACFDVPVTAMTVLVVYSYLAGRRTLRGALIAGLVFGLACATKHNALFLAVLLLAHYLFIHFRSFSLDRDGGGSLRLPPLPLAFVFMAVAAPLIMYLHWPYLWHHPFERFGSYLAFHLNHEHYPISYFDRLLLLPPFPVTFPFVMTAFTMPLGTLALGVTGMGLGLRRIVHELRHGPAATPQTLRSADGDSEGATLLLWGMMALFPMVLIALPNVPIFGGIKHWMPSTPFVALFAALALERAWHALQTHVPRSTWQWAPAALLALVLLPALVDSMRVHPYGLSYYNALAGGIRGGASKNLQRTFWGHSSRRLIEDELNRAPASSRVFFNRTNFDSYRMYQRDGLLQKGVQYASSVETSDFALVFHQGGYMEELYKVWQNYGTHTPIADLHLRGVPLVSLYAKPGRTLTTSTAR